MSKQAANTSSAASSAALAAIADDVRGILGALDGDKVVAIMALQPTVTDLEHASLWLAGDTDVFGPGKALEPIARQIVDILTADEEEELRSPA